MLNFFVKRGDRIKVEEIVERMKDEGVKKDKITVNMLVSFLVKNGGGEIGEEVERLIREMEENDVKWDEELGSSFVFSTLSYPPRSGGGSKALEYASKMKKFNLKIQPATHGAVVESLCRDGALKEAINYYREHKSSNTCGTLIRGVSGNKKFEISLKIFENFKESESMDPSEFVYSEIIKSAGDECNRLMFGGEPLEERLAKAEEVAGVAKNIFDSIPSDPSLKNVVVCNSMIRCFGEAHLVKSAFEVYEEMKEGGVVEPTMITFGSLSAACERSGETKRVGQILEEMKDLGMKPNEFVYGSAIAAFKKKGNWRRGVNLLSKMAGDDSLTITTSTFNNVLSACAEGGELESLMKVWKIMKGRAKAKTESKPNLQTFTTIIDALCAAKQPNQASDLIVEMGEVWKVPCSVEIFTKVVTSCEKERQFKNALKVYAAMADADIKYYEIGVLDNALKR
eukprot:CAMPEP_0118660150 /NCGR_PEP_ID=MMETSP0785-20121206/15510_1 /TAXON_ID=91992 /ORGANISM="Bolidomonas pacifica, Strain CCMP 1866" /LENGTH=454 /DNA_ID=CAMNT_0006553339 /DNA_START=1 /DNA_END=1362 /DNA_ORIENTATION=-